MRNSIQESAALLFNAQQSGQTIDLISKRFPDLTSEDAYQIQEINIKRSEMPIFGYKLGYTSVQMREQMNISEPNFGVLLRDQWIDASETFAQLSREDLIHPLIEPEIAILIGKDIRSYSNNVNDIQSYVSAVMPALEVVDTRYHSYQFTLIDNIADNSSSARFITGKPEALSKLISLNDLRVELLCSGQPLAQGLASDCMENPLKALTWLSNDLISKGNYLQAGQIVMTGGLTKAQVVHEGDLFDATFGKLGNVQLKIL
jgi:2-keto-4-pentenoate hydratase